MEHLETENNSVEQHPVKEISPEAVQESKEWANELVAKIEAKEDNSDEMIESMGGADKVQETIDYLKLPQKQEIEEKVKAYIKQIKSSEHDVAYKYTGENGAFKRGIEGFKQLKWRTKVKNNLKTLNELKKQSS